MVFEIKSEIFNENAIIVTNSCSVETKVTYQDVKRISSLINDFLSEKLPEKHVCVGLQMYHNIYIPSLVISLQTLELPFMFLTEDPDEIEKLCDSLGVGWILSFSPSLIGESIGFLTIDADVLYLHKTGSSSMKFSDICYIIQTSGSTGEPKLVRVTNHCINSNIQSLSQIFEITSNDTIYFGTPLTFDPSIIELGLALHNGACLLICNDKLTSFPLNLGITVLQIVPSIFLRLSSAQIKSILNSKLRVLAFGGEVFPADVLSYDRNESLRLFNLYGVTEMSCWASVAEVKHQEDISIGDPLADTIVQVRDTAGNQLVSGEGEIYIGSDTRLCLLNNEDIPPKFRATGDIGLINHSKIYFTGRTNDVFKRFGHKLHMVKIEKLIKTLTNLDNKCVWCKEHSKLLTFFLLENCDFKAKVLDKVRIKLLHGLPKQCFPDFFDIVAKFPVTAHGKINRNALEFIYLLEISKNTVSNCDSFKILLSKYLGTNPLEFEKWSEFTFFENGGNSITAIQFLSELGTDSNTFMSLFFEKNLRICSDYLRNARTILKRGPILKLDSYEAEKRVKLEYQMNVQWSYDLKACVDATPLIFEYCSKRLIAVGSFSHILAILDEKGQIMLEYTLPDVIESTPCQSKCKSFLYVTCFDGNVYSLFIEKQSIKWTYMTGDRIKSSPILCQNGEAVVCGSYDKYIHCINSKNGTCIWKTSIAESVTSALLLSNNHLYAATIFGSCLCLSETTGEILWQYKTNYPIFGSPSAINNQIICANVQGQIICLSLNGEVKWTYECNAYLYSSITQFKDFAIFGTHNNNLYVLQIGESEAKVKCIINLGDKMSSQSNLCKLNDRDLIIMGANGGDVFIVDFDGVIVGEIKLPGEVFSSVAVDHNRIYVGCRDNNIYCISIK